MKKIPFKGKKILITGGSGSLGRHLIKALLPLNPTHIYSLSRDEALIKDAQIYLNNPKKVTFQIGDIKDPQSIKRLVDKVDVIFHLASQKDVSLSQQFPHQALKTNLLGLLNILESANNIKLMINISTDKVIGVVNYYGATKLLAEGLVKEANTYNKGKFISIRLPNLFASRGSVIDIWKKQITANNKITLTDPSMTRYFITLENAADYIVKTSQQQLNPESIYFPKKNIKKFKLETLAAVFIKIYGNKTTKIQILGSRPGEKTHEDYIKGISLESQKNLTSIILRSKMTAQI